MTPSFEGKEYNVKVLFETVSFPNQNYKAPQEQTDNNFITFPGDAF